MCVNQYLDFLCFRHFGLGVSLNLILGEVSVCVYFCVFTYVHMFYVYFVYLCVFCVYFVGVG